MPSMTTGLQSRRGHGRRLVPALAALAVLLVSCCDALAQPAPPAEPWIVVEGSWQVTGKKQTLATEGSRPAAILLLSGAVLLTSGEGLSRGFLGEAVGYDDGDRQWIGRAVFTDERGDRVFARLEGDPVAAGRRMAGTFTGGTGRYAGSAGEFTVEWQFVVESEEGTVEARGVRLVGRYRREPPAVPTADPGEGPR